MGNYENLKQSITEVIRTNGNQEITGAVLQSTLLTIISTVGANATFAGIATPTTNPGTPDGPVFWLASESGTYSNFGGVELQDGLSVLMWNGSWSSQQIFGVDDVPTAGSDNLVKSGGVQEELALGAVYDVSAKNPTAGPSNDGRWESLSALLSDTNLNTLIPIAVRKGGMNIKFVRSSDNKYVQYFLTNDEWSVSEADWEKINIEEEVNSICRYVPLNNHGFLNQYTGQFVSTSADWWSTDYFAVKEGMELIINERVNANDKYIFFYDEAFNFVGGEADETGSAYHINSVTIPSGVYYARVHSYNTSGYCYCTNPNLLTLGTSREKKYNELIKELQEFSIIPVEGNDWSIYTSVVNNDYLFANRQEYKVLVSSINIVAQAGTISIYVKNVTNNDSPTLLKSIEAPFNGTHIIKLDTPIEIGGDIQLFVGGKVKYKYGQTENIAYEWNGYRIWPNNLVCMAYELVVKTDVRELTKDVSELDGRVEVLEENEESREISPFILPTALYSVANDTLYTEGSLLADGALNTRNYSTKVFIDHFFKGLSSHPKFKKNDGTTFIPIYAKLNGYNLYDNASTPNTTNDKLEQNISCILSGAGYEDYSLTIKNRSVRNKATQNTHIRLLCIGDSVTEGYLAGYNAPYATAPTTYWSWVKALFEMDMIENGNSGFDFVSLGNKLGNSIDGIDFDIDFDGITKQDVKAFACGVGGTKTTDWLSPTLMSSTNVNPFYDAVNNKFSLQYWVENYRTLIVNNDGTVTRCTSENKGVLAPEDTTKNNVCEPTHVLIQLGYNQKYSSNNSVRTTYLNELNTMINTIHTEYPNVVIILSLPDTAGTYYPDVFKDYVGEGNDIYSLDFTYGTAKDNHDSIAFMNKDLMALEDITNNIWYCPSYFASPLCIGASSRKANEVTFLSSKSNINKLNVHCGALPYLHPNNAAHASWAYQIYSLIKYSSI